MGTRRGAVDLGFPALLLGLALVVAGAVCLFLLLTPHDEDFDFSEREIPTDRPASPRDGPAPDRAPPLPPSQIPEFLLRGKVLDGGGAPIAKAMVIVASCTHVSWGGKPKAGGPFDHLSTILDLVERGERIPYPWCRTGPEGGFSFSAVAGEQYLIVMHPGYSRFVERISVTGPMEREISLYAGLTVSGRVVDPQGKGLPGIEVAGFQPTRSGELRYMGSRRVRSDAQGMWSLDGFVGGMVKVSVVLPPGSEAMVLDSALQEVSAGAAGIEFRVLVLGFVRFRARLRKGPILKTQIYAEVLDKVDGLTAFRVVPANLALGVFVLKAPPGRWAVRLHSAGFGAVERVFEVKVGVETGDDDPVLFGGEGTLCGTVDNLSPGATPFVFIEKMGEGLPFTAGLRTTTNGSFGFEGLIPGRYRIVVLQPGRVPAHLEQEVQVDEVLTIVLEAGNLLSPLPPGPLPFARQKGMRIFLDVKGFDLVELVSWLAHMSMVPFTVTPDAAETFRKKKRLVDLTLLYLPLEDVVAIIARYCNLTFDRETCRFERP
jgi:protocatechuate 3,4-dioxygenase beta subunit